MSDDAQPLGPADFYWDDGRMVLTARYHLRRGTCCGNGCRHCPYQTGSPLPTDRESDGPGAVAEPRR